MEGAASYIHCLLKIRYKYTLKSCRKDRESNPWPLALQAKSLTTTPLLLLKLFTRNKYLSYWFGWVVLRILRRFKFNNTFVFQSCGILEAGDT